MNDSQDQKQDICKIWKSLQGTPAFADKGFKIIQKLLDT